MLSGVNATTKSQFSQILQVSRALKLTIQQLFKEMFTKFVMTWEILYNAKWKRYTIMCVKKIMCMV